MKVYIVVSDTPRSDLDNIYNIHTSKKKALEEAKYLNEMTQGFNQYTVMEFYVKEDGDDK